MKRNLICIILIILEVMTLTASDVFRIQEKWNGNLLYEKNVPFLQTEVSVNLEKKGLFELQIIGEGSGVLRVWTSGSKERLMVLGDSGIYGFLFESQPGDSLKMQVNNGKMKLHSIDLVPAMPEQERKYREAEMSFSALGYYGVDPQRPIPGKVLQASDFSNPKYAITESALLLDFDYDFAWVANPENIRVFFQSRNIPVLDVKQAAAYLKEKISRGADKSSLIMAMGVIPEALLNEPYDNSLLVQYLKNGGRIVWGGDVPFHWLQDEFSSLRGVPGGSFSNESSLRCGRLLGLETDRRYWYGYPGTSRQTNEAKQWGLEKTYPLNRPVVNKNMSCVFSISGKGEFAGSGFVNLKAENPLSGFIFISGTLDGNDRSMMRDLYRLAFYSGSPIKVPEPAVAKSEAEKKNAELLFGDNDIRRVFLRGEDIELGVRLNGKAPGSASVQLLDSKGKCLREFKGTVKAEGSFGFFNLSGLKHDVYTAVLKLNGNEEIRRELYIAPPVHTEGLVIAEWINFSPKWKRSEYLLRNYFIKNSIEPLICDSGSAARDLALWLGIPFPSRRMAKSENAFTPEDYDNWRRTPDGEIRPLPASNNRPITQSYDNPFRRKLEAERFGKLVEFDNLFPAFRQVTLTADDYSQWFGTSYNRFAKEKFFHQLGKELPVINPKEKISGIIPDDDLRLAAEVQWAETHGSFGKEMSRQMLRYTDGEGKVGPIPGAMMIPMNAWCSMYPAFGFGPNGYNLSSFYYYNSYWQPLAACLYWVECAAIGNRNQDVWAMPDSYVSRNPSYHEQVLWHMLAGGVRGLAYFRYVENQNHEAALPVLRQAGQIARRYGLLLNSLQRKEKKAALLIPFENSMAAPANWYQIVIPYANLLLAGMDDIEPAAPEELRTGGYSSAILLNIQVLRESTVRKLEEFIADGGKVYCDAQTARIIPIKGAKVLDDKIASLGNSSYFKPELISSIKENFAGSGLNSVECSGEGIIARRFHDTLGNEYLYLIDSMSSADYAAFQAAHRRKMARPELESERGYGSVVVKTTVNSRNSKAIIAFDVLAGKEIPVEKSSFAVDIGRWSGKLIALLPESPANFEVEAPEKVVPGIPMELIIRTSGRTVVPFTISAVQPDGTESREYKQRLLSNASGREVGKFEFAVNDLKGKWIFQIVNEFTGAVKKCSIELR